MRRMRNPSACFRIRRRVLLTFSASLLAMSFPLSAQSPIRLVQHASKDAGTTMSSSLSFSTANTAGNWIAVCVRAGHSNEAFAVRDSNGNPYRQAVVFNVTADVPNGDTLAIFYAENIAGGSNAVTISDSISGTLRFAILEYSGVASANSLDAAAVAQGNGASPSSGVALTTSNGDLTLQASLQDPATHLKSTFPWNPTPS
jgi:hypothetical protein